MYDKSVDVLKAFRYRLDPKPEQLDFIRGTGGCRRYVFNRLLAERTSAFKLLGENPTKAVKQPFNKEWSYKGMAKKITQWRAETPWLDACPVHALQNAAKDLQGAYKNWWAGLGDRPTYKKKSSGGDSWRESDKVLVEVNGHAVKLPKIGWVKAHISKPFDGEIRQATVKQEGDEWYVSVLSKVSIKVPENNQPPIALDLGVAHAATDSSGVHYDLCVETESETRWLRHLAKEVSRKEKGSRNRAKAQKRLNKARRQIRRRIKHETHKLTYDLAKNHSLVALEDLSVKNMTASAAGTVESPGKNVAAKSGLNREILARGWGEIRRQLEYKCLWYGSRLVLVSAQYSSQECSVCGHISRENRKTQSEFACVSCGHAENADINAAKVILKRALAAGHAVTACGEEVRRRLGHAASVRQEPTRGAQQCAV